MSDTKTKTRAPAIEAGTVHALPQGLETALRSNKAAWKQAAQ